MPCATYGTDAAGHNVVVSLCDYSGNWSRPFNLYHGYTVVRFDMKHGDDVTDYAGTMASIEITLRALRAPGRPEPRVAGVLMAPPCTDFTVSGARWWPAKDADGRTEASVRLVRACLAVVKALQPVFWALENPVGRLPRLVAELGAASWYFNPCEYAGFAPDPEAERYTKRTGMWTNVARPKTAPRNPIMYESAGKRGSWMWAKLGGRSERTKELRSNTPQGFALSFSYAAVALVETPTI